MNARIRTILLVSLVTALIWLWAEGESLSTIPLNPRIVIVPEGNDLQLENQDRSWTGSVRLRLQGSTRGLSFAEKALGNEIRLKLGHPGVPSLPGEQQVVNLEEALSQVPEIRAAGLSVQDVTPASTVIRIVKLVSRDFPVRPGVPTGIDLLGDPTASPARVTVQMPEHLAARLTADPLAQAVVSIQEIDPGRDDAAQSILTIVTIPAFDGMDGAEGVIISPAKVNVTFRLKRSVDSMTVASVPVWISVPPTEGTRWNIEPTDQFLRDVTFTGPIDSIAKIRSREVIPLAEVQLSSDELEEGIESKEVIFVSLPPGVQASVAVRTVRLKVTRRKAEAPAGAPEIPDPAPTPEFDERDPAPTEQPGEQ